MPAPITKTKLPEVSQLWARCGAGDFLDCYRVASDMRAPQAAKTIVDFPGWAKALVALRNVITAPFGLKNDGPDAPLKLGLFPVETSSPSEVIAGFDDRHLNFRVSVLSLDGHIHLATWVHPHNIGGRLYLRAILPFHILIARNALARVATLGQSEHKSPVPE